jgi:maleamate amidohydrolase
MRWTELLDEEERARLASGGWGRAAGIGQRPALLIIDAQNYMIGEPEAPDNLTRFPFSCGQEAARAIEQIGQLLQRFRASGWPVVFTRFVQLRGGAEDRALHRKLGPGTAALDGLYHEGTSGAEIIGALAPRPDELVIDKRGRSAFFGTALHARLVDWNCDTCIVTGGSTSGCVRPTVCDAEQLGYRVIIPEEAVFDRFAISHAVNLFDMHRAQADVMLVPDLLSLLRRLEPPSSLPKSSLPS